MKVANKIEMRLSDIIPSDIDQHNIYFACIGTDRSTGDSLGPLVGTYLTEKGFENVIGTIDAPLHAENLDERLRVIPENSFVIAIDAALGEIDHIGKIRVREGSLSPGKGVGKELTNVGDVSISGVVNMAGHMEFFVLQNTRLSLVMRMARKITSGIVLFSHNRSVCSKERVKNS